MGYKEKSFSMMGEDSFFERWWKFLIGDKRNCLQTELVKIELSEADSRVLLQ